MLKITMLRHGRTYGNTRGRYIGRTDERLLDAEREALARLRPEPVECVFASPMLRCRETAELLYPGQEPVLLDDFRECDFGEFENKNYQELSGNESYQKWIDSNGTLGFPGGESQIGFRSRCLGAFDKLVELCAEREIGTAAMVVHGGTIMSILAEYGVPRAGYFSWQVKNGEGYRVRMNPELWDDPLRERQLVVDGRIVREELRG